jgi:hypothetical protein
MKPFHAHDPSNELWASKIAGQTMPTYPAMSVSQSSADPIEKTPNQTKKATN